MDKMKKLLLVIFLLIIVYGCYRIMIKEHDVFYNINKYKIHEHFYINKDHFYDITINKNKENYTYTIKKNLSKDKRIIKNIKTFKSNNLICIVPIYKKDLDLNIYCNLDNIQVSNDYLLKTYNKDFKEIKKKVKKYKIKYPRSYTTKTNYKKLSVFQKNILKEDNYYIWNYKGVYSLSKSKLNYKKILNYDLYDNIMATTVKNYYVLFENNSVNGIKKVYVYNNQNNNLTNFKLDKVISKDSYINGVVDNLIYVTDRKEKKEYTIDIFSKKIKQVDNNLKYTVYENNKKKKLSKSDYFMEDQFFNKFIVDNKITDSRELIKVGNYYYYFENNKIYKVLDTNKKYRTLLLELEDIKEWNIYDNKIIIMANDIIYSYTEENGLRKIIKSNELKYNYKNIYKVGKK